MTWIQLAEKILDMDEERQNETVVVKQVDKKTTPPTLRMWNDVELDRFMCTNVLLVK